MMMMMMMMMMQPVPGSQLVGKTRKWKAQEDMSV